MARSRGSSIFGVLLIVFLFFIILMFFAAYTMRGSSYSSSSVEIENGGKGEIAVVELEGIIMDSKQTIEKLFAAEKDDDFKAIIVRINSPGGAVGPTQEIYEEIRRIDKKKPVYASFGTVAASGGYYVGAATRKIFSNAGTLTGSIGVIMQFVNLSKLYKWAKVSQKTIKSGKFKDAGNPTRALTKKEEQMLTSLLNGVHKTFVADIEKKRGKRIKGDIWKLAQGQIFSGQEAKEHGLVDEIGSLWTAGRRIHAELNLKSEFGLNYIKKKKDVSFFELLDKLDEVVSNINWSTKLPEIPMLLYRATER